MGVESHDREGNASGGGLGTGDGEHGGVSDVDTVKVAHAKHTAAEGGGEGLPIGEDLHGGEYTGRRGLGARWGGVVLNRVKAEPQRDSEQDWTLETPPAKLRE